MIDPKFIDVAGIRTRYFDKGSGETLLLVHGSHMGTPDACPQWSLQNRPMRVTSKPANGERPRQGCFNLLPPGRASPFWFSNYVDRI